MTITIPAFLMPVQAPVAFPKFRFPDIPLLPVQYLASP